MKKGLLVWEAPYPKKNSGDYIQSVAAEQYTGSDVVFVERDRMCEYDGEPIKVIVNGWFMHHPEKWPPAEGILPLFTSFHINPAIGERMLHEKAVEYFKNYVRNYGPVGARDRGTERLFKSKGIDAYFSNCLTLTLGKTYKHNPDSKRVCFADAYFDVPVTRWEKAGCLLTFLLKRNLITTICKKKYNDVSRKNILKTAAFYKIYTQHFEDEVLMNAEYIEHMVLIAPFKDEESKFKYAKDLLKKYADSKLVVTSRIHAALPCLAMGTPTIFVINDDLQENGRGLVPKAKGRFDGILELFHVMECLNKQLKPILGFKIEKKIGINHSIRNKENHLKYAEELDKQCTAFIQNAVKRSEVGV